MKVPFPLNFDRLTWFPSRAARVTPSGSPIYSGRKYYSRCSRMPRRMTHTKIWPISGCRRGTAQFFEMPILSKIVFHTLFMCVDGLIYIPPVPDSQFLHDRLHSQTTDSAIDAIPWRCFKAKPKSWTYFLCRDTSCIPKYLN